MAYWLASAPVSADKDITVELDGKVIEFDVAPASINDCTMVPLRKIFEEIGALVKWDDETQTVIARKNSKTITLTVDSADLQIDKGKTDDAGNPITETVTLEVNEAVTDYMNDRYVNNNGEATAYTAVTTALSAAAFDTEVEKDGTVAIYRDYNKNCLTLITCTRNSNTKQTVYILEQTN